MTLFNLLETGTIVITSITSIGLALILSCGDDNSPAESQIPVFIVWETIFGGVGDEFAYSKVTTNDSGAMLVGSTTSFGSGGKNVYLVRINSSGDTLWTRTFGGADDNEGNSIAPVSDGAFIICGYTKSFGAG